MTPLQIVYAIDTNVLSVVILLVLLTVAFHRHERDMVQHKIFLIIVCCNIILNILEAASWLADTPVGLVGPDGRWLNLAVNTVLYTLVPFPVAFWLLYAHYQVFHDNVKLRRACWAVLPVIAINAVLALLSPLTGWYFTVSDGNYYRRGPLFIIHVVLVYGILAVTCLMVLRNRQLLEKRVFRALLLFIIPPVIGSVLQVAYYGLLLNWVAMMVAVLIVYFHIQDRGLNTDYLTGTYNRRHFEQLVRDRIRRAFPGQSFAVVLADMDNFKRINDQHGHKTGDEALKTTVDILRRVLRRNDLIARFGGDEFYILLELSDPNALQVAIGRIYREFAKFNSDSGQPFLLELSMGGAVFDPLSNDSAEQFLRQVDQLMYQEKARRISQTG